MARVFHGRVELLRHFRRNRFARSHLCRGESRPGEHSLYPRVLARWHVRPDALSDILSHAVSAECVTDGSCISRLSALPTAQVAGPDYGTPLIHGLHEGLKFGVLAAGIEGCDCLAWRGRVLQPCGLMVVRQRGCGIDCSRL